jgi:prevent-host-death family protein
MTTVSITDARDEFADLVNRVAYGHERIIVARRGKSLAALVPPEDMALLEMIENEIDLAAARAALADPATAEALDWSMVRERLGR